MEQKYNFVWTIEELVKIAVFLEEVYMGISKSDWKLFRARIADEKKSKHVPLGKILTSLFMNFKERISTLFQNSSMLEKSYETMLNYDFRDSLHFGIPTLFVFGEEESICPSEMLKACFEDIESPKNG